MSEDWKVRPTLEKGAYQRLVGELRKAYPPALTAKNLLAMGGGVATASLALEKLVEAGVATIVVSPTPSDGFAQWEENRPVFFYDPKSIDTVLSLVVSDSLQYLLNPSINRFQENPSPEQAMSTHTGILRVHSLVSALESPEKYLTVQTGDFTYPLIARPTHPRPTRWQAHARSELNAAIPEFLHSVSKYAHDYIDDTYDTPPAERGNRPEKAAYLGALCIDFDNTVWKRTEELEEVKQIEYEDSDETVLGQKVLSERPPLSAGRAHANRADEYYQNIPLPFRFLLTGAEYFPRLYTGTQAQLQINADNKKLTEDLSRAAGVDYGSLADAHGDLRRRTKQFLDTQEGPFSLKKLMDSILPNERVSNQGHFVRQALASYADTYHIETGLRDGNQFYRAWAPNTASIEPATKGN